MKVHLITIGDEILIGQIIDTNSAWMAQQLNLIGAEVTGIHSVGDGAADIENALTDALRQADVVLLTGGLGPTRDDITKQVLADYVGTDLAFNEPTYERIVRFFAQLGRTTTEAHRQQCYLPRTAELLYNKMGTAPGMWLEKDGQVIVSMPGVPYEMKYIMENAVLPRLRERYPSTLAIAHRTLLTAGEGESRIAQRIAAIEDNLPPHIKLAYLPNLGQVRLRLSGRGADEAQLQEELNRYVTEISTALPELFFGEAPSTLAGTLGQQLRARGLTIGTAESCTGGLVAHLLTSVPGSSAYYSGSIVAYSYELKETLLGVSPDTLAAHGAVSEATVREMARGALDRLGVDIAVSISGIAGPGGGTPDKPVGTIWMAVADRERVVTKLLRAGKDREKNIAYTANHALNFVRLFLG